MITYDETRALLDTLEDAYSVRHADLRQLREFWHGNYWGGAGDDQSKLGSMFAEIAGRQGQPSPEIKLVNNLLHAICVKYQTYLSTLPMIRVTPDAEASELKRQQAILKERVLYGTWHQTKMVKVLGGQMAWYTPLFGDCFLGCYPDVDENRACAIVRSPELAYPIPGYEGDLDGVIFKWEMRDEIARRQFPKYKGKREVGRTRPVLGRFRKPRGDDLVEVIEFSDKGQFGRWVGETQINGVDHGFGWNIFQQVQWIHVPDEPFGHGAVEQIANLVEMGNATLSLLFQAFIENVFPTLVLIDPAKAPQQIMRGPGSVIPLNAGGGVEWLHPPVQALGAQVGFLQANEQNVKEIAGMPGVNFGQSPASSIVTGKAVNELQGAATGSTIEFVQGVSLGPALAEWNEHALFLYQTLFADQRVRLKGVIPGSAYEINPRNFEIVFKGSEVVGSQANDVVFQPAMDLQSKLVMNLQALGAGLISKSYAREQIGIPDSAAMDNEIVMEQIRDAVVMSATQALVAAGAPADQAVEVEKQALAFLGGAVPEMPAPVPPAGAAPAGGGQPAPGAPPASLPGPAPAPALPPGAPAPPPAAAPAGGGPGGEDAGLTLEDAQALFGGMSDLEGRVFLVGEIVQEGYTENDLEVALTEAGDRQTIISQAPDLRGRVHFTRVATEPREQFVEVTPGAIAAQPAPPSVPPMPPPGV